jgi:general secretion pathway protein A
MFLDYYGLREQPFGVTPDPRFLYFSPAHREALASLFCGIDAGRGFLALIAEPGMGKTTLLFQLLERLKGSVRSAFLFQTQCNSHELLRYLLEALGLDSRGQDIVQMHAQLNQLLYREALAGRRVVVFIDEAQNLSDSVLETVRLLSDFEAADRKLLQIVLAGQPDLAQRLMSPGLAQLRQRLSVIAGLERLPAAETVRYVNHRLQVAGYDSLELFTPGALVLIAERSEGIPRNINNICFNAMSLGLAMGRKKIEAMVVQEALHDLSLESLVSQPKMAPAAAPAVRAVTQIYYSWMKDNLFGRRAYLTTALAALLACLGIYVGTRSGASTTHSFSQVINHDSSSVVGTSGAESASTRTIPAAFSSVQFPTPAPTKPSVDSTGSLTYLVQPNDTLRDLCMSIVGRYDDAVLAKIRELNPDLKDPNRLDVGQEVRLPLSLPD